LRQRDQHWQVKLEAMRAELQTKHDQNIRRLEVESTGGRQHAIRELEAQMREEIQQKEEAAQLKAKQREQNLTAQLAA